MQRFHFISGLPRSGSTLTAAILRQNPELHAGMSSPVASLFDTLIAQVSAGSELAPMVDKDQRARLLRGLFESYYADRPETVVFDTNRAWTAQLPALTKLFPEAKLICCVRDVAWVMDSLERQFRANAFEHTRLFSTPGERATVYTRLEALAGPNRLVGYAWQALREACYGEQADRLLILDYEILTRRPEEAFGLIHEFLKLAPFEYDFDNLSYDAPAFDQPLGLAGLHRVRPRVAPHKRQTILPPDLFKRFSNMAFWRELNDSRAFRITAAPSQAPSSNGEAEPHVAERVATEIQH